MPTNLPKIGLKKLSLYVSELVLRWDDSDKWIEEPSVLTAWHWLFFASIAFVAVGFVWQYGLNRTLRTSPAATLYFRWFVTLGIAALLLILADLAALHYRHMLLTGRDVRFSSIATFWFWWVFLFGYLYVGCYDLRPSLFSFSNPPTVPSAVEGHLSLAAIHTMVDFMIYSAGVATSVEQPGVTSASPLITAVNVIEVIGSLLIVGLVIATFVGKSANSKSP